VDTTLEVAMHGMYLALADVFSLSLNILELRAKLVLFLLNPGGKKSTQHH